MHRGWTALGMALLLVGCPDGQAASSGAGLGSSFGSDATGGDTMTTGVSVSASAETSDSNSGSATTDDTPATGTAATSDDPSSTGDSIGDGSTTDEGSTTAVSGSSSSTGDPTEAESSSSTGDPPADTHQLYQGVYNGAQYEFGYEDAIEILDITGGPADTDWNRWAMLNDNGSFRLYFMQAGSDDTIYQFVYNPATQDYEYGLGAAIDQIGITGAPADADMSSFAMLYSGTSYRLYAQSASDPLRIHQFVYNPATESYEYGLGAAIEEIDVTMFPGATDFSGWGMLWEDDTYRFYAFSDAAHDAVAQGAYNSASGDYEYDFMSIPVIDIIGFPADTNTDDFAMVHDGSEFRLYMLRE